MADTVFYTSLPSLSPATRLRFPMLSGGFLVSGLSGTMTVQRSIQQRQGGVPSEDPMVVIVRGLNELGNTGLYEMTLSLADTVGGPTVFRFTDPSADVTAVVCYFRPRSSMSSI